MVRAPGSHPPNIKNRSSKHLICLTKNKSIYRSMSNEALAACSSLGEARKEIDRRKKKNAKKNGAA